MNRSLGVLAAVLSFGLSAPGFASATAVPTFTLESGVRLSSAMPQSVVDAGSGLYRLYFIRDGFQVLSASSTDKVNWFEDAGFRISTSPTASVDSSSITAATVFPLNAGGFRMLYTGLSSTDSWHVLSATSADGVNWVKESGVRLQVSSGAALIDGLSTMRLSASSLRLYYVQMSTTGFTPPVRQIQSATSSNEGLAWTFEKVVLSTNAFGVSVSTLSNGNVRMMWSALTAGVTFPLQIGSAFTTDGVSFTQEGVVLSTIAPARLGSLVLDRSTETFRWRLFHELVPIGSSVPAAFSARTFSPLLVTVSPTFVYNTGASTAFTVSGEVFDLAPTVSLVRGGTTLAGTGLTRVSDLKVTGSFPTNNAPLGNYNVVITNGDGASSTLSNAVKIDIPGGDVAIKDNLFKPLAGGKAKIDVTVYGSGTLTVKLFTLNGELVKTVFDGPVTPGTTTIYWPGDTGGGHTVASGLYLLHAEGPRTNITKKIIVVK